MKEVECDQSKLPMGPKVLPNDDNKVKKENANVAIEQQQKKKSDR